MSTGAQSKPDDLSRELFAAQRTVDIAEITMVHGRSHVRTLIDKGDYGFATLIDIEIERLVRAELAREIPEIPLLGEEDGGAELGSEAAWVLDPIDGTANYADGSPLCPISLALVRGGRPVIAIVSAPLLGERFMAVEGVGAFLNGMPIQVARTEVGDPLVALSDFAFGRKHRATNSLRFAVIEELVARSMRLRIHGSVALDLAWLAAGRMSATIALSNRAWDVSAGVLLVREAGGEVFDETGGAHALSSDSTLATGPALRDTLVDVIAAARDRGGGDGP